MIEKNNVAAIIVTYNIKANELKKNLNSYIEYVDKVIIVDNSDIKNDFPQLKDEKIEYISLNGNQGIGKGLNEGIKYAIKLRI